MTHPQLVDVLWERVTHDGPGGPGTVTRTFNELDAAINAAAGELLAPYRHADIWPPEDEWLDELQYDAAVAAMRHAMAALTQTVLERLPGAPAGLVDGSGRLTVDLALPRDEQLPEHLAEDEAA